MADTTPPASPPEKKSRAGRNLPAAIASGVGLAVVVVLSLFFVKWLFVLVVIAALLIAVNELYNAFAQRDVRIARAPVFGAVVVIPAVAYVWGIEAQLVATGIVILLVLLWRIRRGFEGYVADVTASAFVVTYLPFMAGFLMLTLATQNGAARVIVFILLTICNDIGGYATGVLFGKHPIAPQISPKKSWEGFAGSLLLQGVVGVVCWIYVFDAPWWQGLIVGMVMTVTATAGDFAESAIKRDLGVKDMGTFLPGHGGMMDRLDSLVPNAFTSWALFTWFLGTA